MRERESSAGIFSTVVETAFLIGILIDGEDEREAEASLRELHGLADTMGLRVVGSDGVRVRSVSPRFLIGSGRAQEIAAAAQEVEADCLIFDRPLSPSQQRNWERSFGVPCADQRGGSSSSVGTTGVFTAAADAGVDPPFPPTRRLESDPRFR